MTWMAIISAIAAALFASPHILPTPKPDTKVVVVEPPKPMVDPDHKEEVVIPPRPPTPLVNPPVIVTGVTIADTKGNALGNSVEPGVMFIVTGQTGTTLTPVPAVHADMDIGEVADSKFFCTLRNGFKLQIVVTGGGNKPSVLQIQCNQGPQPPPVPVNPPTPVNPPVPVPDPNHVVSVRVLMLFDATANMSKDQIDAMDSPTVVDLLNAKCKKDMTSRPAWRKWDKDTVASDYWSSLKTACSTEISSKSLKLPVLCIEDGAKLTICEISNEQSVLTALNQTFGG